MSDMGREYKLDELSARARVFSGLESPPGAVQCHACAHHCQIREGKRGLCLMRFNRKGTLYGPSGYVAGVACDPIEKKPFFHVLPGQNALSFGMLGCNFHCWFCQNWQTSQLLRDPQAAGMPPQPCSARELVDLALRSNAPMISSTYNEPLITCEWAAEIFALARERGLMTSFVSNGFASAQVLDFMEPCLDAMNVDLKCFTEKNYARLGGRLRPVLDTIGSLHQRGIWVEVVTLVVPGFNDSVEELRSMADFVASVDPDIPWHVTAYHADYKAKGAAAWTPVEKIRQVLDLGREAGLRYVYGGNLRGLGRDENTYCPQCQALLVERSGFSLLKCRLAGGCCPDCGQPIPGRWT